MTPEAERLFHQLADLDPEARRAALDGMQIAADERREVEELLAYDAAGPQGSQLTAQVAEAARWAIESGGMTPGSLCGPHRLVKLLGAGGMGAVYLAEREEGDVEQRIAVKFLNASFTGGRFEQQLLSERRLLALLSHPNIARFLDSGQLESGQPYLAMEYVDGQPIDRYCEQLHWRDVLGVFRKVCEAAAYAHANLIVHRDLKPGNILVTADGEPKLIDFGVGKLLDFEKRHTQTAMRMLTPAYASPEQLLGNPVGTAADVYGLGATLYHLLAGRPPFDTTSPAADVETREPPPLQSIRKGLPQDLSNIVAKAMRPDPAQRYGSVAHLVADLDALIASRPVSASRGTLRLRPSHGQPCRNGGGVAERRRVHRPPGPNRFLWKEGVTAACRRMAQLERERKRPDRGRHHVGALPFIGRAAEIRRLTNVLRAAMEVTDARVALITGAPGVGKTRLAEEMAARAQRVGARVGIGRSWGDGGAPPLWPWRAILRDLGAPSHLLAQGLGKTVDERFARFAAVLDHLRLVASSPAPLVIILDDVHLADEATLLLARFVLREQRELPLFVVLTRRDANGAATPEARDLLSEIERNATLIVLHGLPLAAIRTYLSTLGLRSLAPGLLQAVATITKGNPLHLRQVAIRSALDGDVAAALGRGTEDILARLSPLERRIVAVAAMLGPETTTIEIAAVSDASIAKVDDALSRAAALGLLERASFATVTFVHDLVRQAALATQTHPERLDLHARAATALRGNGAQQMLRRAHHALEAASRSIEDGESALGIARETARAIRPAGCLEAAAGLFSRAFNVHAALGLQVPASPLAVEYAESVLACGRLAEARALFDRAARLADSENDSRSLARAAVGLGGIWLREHRLADETARVSSLQRRALASLPADAAVLRARLLARLAAESAYRGGSINLAQTAVDVVRSTRDAQARAEALSLYHHVLTGPEHGAQRLVIAEELIASAVEAEEVLLTLIGLCWRTADLFLLGDARAPAAQEELRVRAEALECRSILFIVRAMEVMLTLRAGRLDEAEAAADACYALGVEVGDVDALAYYGGQLAAIRVFQGREAELAGFVASIAASPTLIPQRERSFSLAAALFALRAGRPGLARSQLEQVAREGIGSLPRSSSWLTSMLAIVELAAALHDAAIARAAYDALLPYAELPIMASLLAVVCFGSTHRLLGVAAATCGEHGRAVEHLAAAVTASERLGHRPAAFQARAELGLAFIARGSGDDARRGYALVDEAIAAAEALGMGSLAGRWRAALTSGSRPQRSPEEATLTTATQPRYWRVR